MYGYGWSVTICWSLCVLALSVCVWSQDTTISWFIPQDEIKRLALGGEPRCIFCCVPPKLHCINAPERPVSFTMLSSPSVVLFPYVQQWCGGGEMYCLCLYAVWTLWCDNDANLLHACECVVVCVSTRPVFGQCVNCLCVQVVCQPPVRPVVYGNSSIV